ncbi:MFS transporter [Sphingobacterium faecium]|uniref:MFS transporter n=1 Tax=Sphingobacterium faecium TaxID=34087 RepID=UPI002468627D|nr:MFS transporter [Sphingobacterium faecium]MDH5827120.1 MFS transporter [Sphingobacterium faecium]
MSTINQTTSVSETSNWKALFKGGNGIKATALALGVMLHATNIYLATTVMPSIIQDIGGLAYYAWNTTLFVVASIIGSVVSANRLAVLGPRRAYQFAIILFFLGSLLCTCASSMYMLLVGRFIQGLGGGLLFALSYAMVRIVFDKILWSRAMALISGMWGIAAFSGPFIGGLFAENNQWRWAFGTLLLICIVIFTISTLILPLQRSKKNPPIIPYFKLTLLVSAALSVSIGSIFESIVINILGVGIALLFLYILIVAEKKSTVRLLPTGAYNLSSPLGATYAVMTLLTIGTSIEIFVPYFAQVISGYSPLQSGYLTVLIAFGWTFSSLLFSGIKTSSIAKIIRLGTILMLVGLVGLTWLAGTNNNPSTLFLFLNCLFLFLVGVGIGLGWPHLLTNVFAMAPEGEEELTSTSVTTVQLMATAFGASLAGLVSNMGGINEPGGIIGAQSASLLLYGVFSIAPLLGITILFKKKQINSIL